MSPDFLHGGYVLAVRHPWQRITIGDTVVFQHATYGTLIKKVVAVEHNRYLFRGSNEASLTSTQIGWQSHKAIDGKMLWYIRPA